MKRPYDEATGKALDVHPEMRALLKRNNFTVTQAEIDAARKEMGYT